MLERHARNQGLFPLETAVREMTVCTAARFGLGRATALRAARGQIQPGWVADLVLLHPDQVLDQASYASPLQPSMGIAAVYLSGELAAENGLTVNAHAGRALRRVG